jgi:glycosyltransferase involved in cell wall biosynthesis
MLTNLVSIIIPTYNRAHLIGETLNSIIVQTYTNWECIIVDDGSIDNTELILRNYIDKDSRFRYYKRPISRLKGPSSCRNYGFELSNGEYVNWFDSDDLYLPNALERFVQYFTEKTDVVVAKIEKIDVKSGCKLSESKIISDNTIEDYFTEKISFYVCGPLWRRRFLEEQALLFDENISNLDDWDFNLRMLYQNPTIVYIAKPLIQYRFHEHSLSKEISKLNFDELNSKFKAIEKNLELIKKNKQANLFVLKTFCKNRYKYILRESLVQNCDHKKYFFKKLVKEQIKLYDFIGIFKTVFGYILFSLFNKGYVFFK